MSRTGNHDAETAIKLYQKFMHLKRTGKIDQASVKEMKKPRCGDPDVDETAGGRVHRYDAVPNFSKWNRTSLTYRFLNYGKDIGRDEVEKIIREAFVRWSKVTTLRFTIVRSGASDFKIGFYSRNHGDFAPFDGRGRVIAHAFFPQDGRIHFDEDEHFATGRGGVQLLWVAMHEIGHAVGLSHSDVRGAIMWPSYDGYKQNQNLHNDDIRGIQSLYGSRNNISVTCSDIEPGCQKRNIYCTMSLYLKRFCNINLWVMWRWLFSSSSCKKLQSYSSRRCLEWIRQCSNT